MPTGKTPQASKQKKKEEDKNIGGNLRGYTATKKKQLHTKQQPQPK